MNLADITPLILTLNEAPNLRHTLQCLNWARQIVIVDSGSTDETLRIAAEFPQVKVHTRTFDTHTQQWNYGLAQVSTEWVLTLDADYRCPEALKAELQQFDAKAEVYFAHVTYCIYGRPLRRSLYPPRGVLFRPSQCQYADDGHTQLLDVRGRATDFLRARILHDDWKPFVPWLHSQVMYAALEAEKILGTPRDQLHWKDRIRTKIVLAPALTLFYCLFCQGLILNGWAGIFYTMQRTLAEFLLAMLILDRRVRPIRVASGE